MCAHFSKDARVMRLMDARDPLKINSESLKIHDSDAGTVDAGWRPKSVVKRVAVAVV